MDNKDVRRVIVASKTHLDVGYTDYAKNVLDRYVDSFIPEAWSWLLRSTRWSKNGSSGRRDRT
jgi:hypothetical protein